MEPVFIASDFTWWSLKGIIFSVSLMALILSAVFFVLNINKFSEGLVIIYLFIWCVVIMFTTGLGREIYKHDKRLSFENIAQLECYEKELDDHHRVRFQHAISAFSESGSIFTYNEFKVVKRYAKANLDSKARKECIK